ncbi:MAG: hypothetical protein K5770_17165 [Lachnospiraceae bacterium]|nr:hypothetical protein [Lachnospiraceae bacterium]
MADFNFQDLAHAYESFQQPLARIYVDGTDITAEDVPLSLTDAEIELSNGFEAGIATFTLTGMYDDEARTYDIKDVKKYLFLGSTVIFLLGYGTTVREVFRGFIARVHFVIPKEDSEEQPRVEVSAMDAKGLMMAGRHSRRLKATCYSDAVKEILAENVFLAQKDDKMQDFTTLNISNTPDKQDQGGNAQTSDKRVEMVEESDYEFIVKAAKKFNFEFFIVGKTLYFIEAKKNTTPLLTLTPFSGMKSIDVGYDISGLVRSVEVRNIDMDQGKYVGDKKKMNSKISLGNKAKPLVEKQSFVYLDPTAQSKAEAGYRAAYLTDTIDYRLGSIQAEFIGLPELVPGRFVELSNFGSPVDNLFYLTRVRHTLESNMYRTVIEGCANSVK